MHQAQPRPWCRKHISFKRDASVTAAIQEVRSAEMVVSFALAAMRSEQEDALSGHFTPSAPCSVHCVESARQW